jgi:hypothetical protein
MPQGPRLVTQYLENISREALEEYPELLRAFVSGRTGIYALFNNGELYYAGLATSLRGRLRHHLKDRHRDSWDTFSAYLTIGDKNLRELESLLIRVIRPPGNRQIGRFAGAENLERKFERALDELHRITKNRLMGRPIKETDESGGFGKSIRIRGRYKNRPLSARLRHDGTVRYNKKIYTSLSAAASAVCKHPVNGRWFWHFERSPGDWVRFPKT